MEDESLLLRKSPVCEGRFRSGLEPVAALLNGAGRAAMPLTRRLAPRAVGIGRGAGDVRRSAGGSDAPVT